MNANFKVKTRLILFKHTLKSRFRSCCFSFLMSIVEGQSTAQFLQHVELEVPN